MISIDNWLTVLDYVGKEQYLLFSTNKLFKKIYLSKFDKTTNVKYCIYNTKILGFAKNNRCPWNINTSLSIVKNNNYDVLRWFYKKSMKTLKHCPWDKRSVLIAGSNGYLDILEFLINNSCVCNPRELYRIVLANNQHDVLQWCIDNGYCCRLTIDL